MRALGLQSEPFGGYTEFDESEFGGIFSAEQEAPASGCKRGSADPSWQSAWRFATAIKSDGFEPRLHFIERICERAIPAGVTFDPRTFKSEFLKARHYRQTRPGYSLRIAVVRTVPIFYRVGGWSGKHIVLAGALPPGAPLPPSEPVAAAVMREAGQCATCGHAMQSQ